MLKLNLIICFLFTDNFFKTYHLSENIHQKKKNTSF